MLQWVAVSCSKLQCVAVFYSVLQCVAVCCSVLQCAAVCCSVLQCAALLSHSWIRSQVSYDVCIYEQVISQNQNTDERRWIKHPSPHYSALQNTATLCNTLQHTATHYNTLQHSLSHYSALQHNATHKDRRRLMKHTRMRKHTHTERERDWESERACARARTRKRDKHTLIHTKNSPILPSVHMKFVRIEV